MNAPETSGTQNPTPRRSSILWRLLRWGLVGLAILVTLAALVLTEESWRGKRAWERYQREMAAKGEKLDWQAFVPPTVPDEQNFAMTPFLAPLYDFQPGTQQPRDTNAWSRKDRLFKEVGRLPGSGSWEKGQPTDFQAWVLELDKRRTNTTSKAGSLSQTQAAAKMLEALQQYEPLLTEIRAATHREKSRFNMRYEAGFPDLLLPHLDVIKGLAVLFRCRASAKLALGSTDEALEDAKAAFAMGNSVADEPFLFSEMVRVAISATAMQPVWEGLAARQWSDPQIKGLEAVLAKTDILSDYKKALRGERAFGNETIERTRTTGGARLLSGLFYQNEMNLSQIYGDFIFNVVDANARRVYPKKVAALDAILKNQSQGFRPYKMFAAMLLPAISKSSMKSARMQTVLDQATVACALERYRLAQGEYPQSLDALTPQFLTSIPHDLFSGEPLKYRRTEDGRFVLYSIGWNEKDDGGVAGVVKKGERQDPWTIGDAVWPMPTN